MRRSVNLLAPPNEREEVRVHRDGVCIISIWIPSNMGEIAAALGALAKRHFQFVPNQLDHPDFEAYAKAVHERNDIDEVDYNPLTAADRVPIEKADAILHDSLPSTAGAIEAINVIHDTDPHRDCEWYISLNCGGMGDHTIAYCDDQQEATALAHLLSIVVGCEVYDDSGDML
jgi:hypothetical protein